MRFKNTKLLVARSSKKNVAATATTNNPIQPTLAASSCDSDQDDIYEHIRLKQKNNNLPEPFQPDPLWAFSCFIVEIKQIPLCEGVTVFVEI